jgi:Peptidase family S58
MEDAITDVAGVKVGHWTDLEAATGCTVVLCEAGAMPGVDVRGAASGTIATDALRPGSFLRAINGVVLSGGSAFGLATASGVMRWCEEAGIGLSFGGQRVPIVAGAILFDLGLGSATVRPGPGEGYAAAAAAKGGAVAQGSVGAGTGATVAKLLGREGVRKGGIGTASEAFGDGLVVGALFAVNCVGDVIDSATGRVIAGARRDGAAGRRRGQHHARRCGDERPPGQGTDEQVGHGRPQRAGTCDSSGAHHDGRRHDFHDGDWREGNCRRIDRSAGDLRNPGRGAGDCERRTGGDIACWRALSEGRRDRGMTGNRPGFPAPFPSALGTAGLDTLTTNGLCSRPRRNVFEAG